MPLAWRDRFQSSISEGARATVAFSPRRSRRRPAGGAATTACLAPSPVREARLLVIATRSRVLRFVSFLASYRSVSFHTALPLFCFLFQTEIRGQFRLGFGFRLKSEGTSGVVVFRLRFRPLCFFVFICRDLTWPGPWFCCIPTCPFLRCS